MAVSSTDSNSARHRAAYRAAVKGDWDDVYAFYSREPMSSVNFTGNTILHILACNRHTDVVRRLLDLPSPVHVLRAQNVKGNTPLHEAIRVGSMEIAKAMVDQDDSLISIRNLLGETPLFWAAAHGKKDILRFLCSIIGVDQVRSRRNDGSTILHAAVIAGFFGLALDIIRLCPALAFARNEMGITALHLLAQSPSSFKSGTIYVPLNIGSTSFIPLQMLAIIIYFCLPLDDIKPMQNNDGSDDQRDNTRSREVRSNSTSGFKRLVRWCPLLREIDDAKQKHHCAEELVEKLIAMESNEGEDPYLSSTTGDRSNDSLGQNRIKGPLLLATKHGIVEVVERILEEFPGAIEWLDDNGKNILHLAAEYRRVGLFEILKSKNFPLTIMVADIDNDGNTPLHLAAKFGEHQPMFVIGAQQQLPSELIWFKRLKRVSLPHLLSLPNNNGKTAQELFRETHQNVLRDAEKWAKETANASMLISTLIATINFTAAFTLPGGYASDTGLPILLKRQDFIAFIAYLSAAMFFSLVTLGVSISASLSRFHQEDFYIALPCKFLVAGNALFLSVVYSLSAFAQALFIQTNAEISKIEFGIGVLAIIGACVVTGLIYIDIMYPVSRCVIDAVFHSLTYQSPY